MVKTAKIFLLSLFAVVLLICGIYLMEGRPSKIETTEAVASFEYSNTKIYYDPIYEDEMLNAQNPSENNHGSTEQENTNQYSCETYSAKSLLHQNKNYFRESEYVLDIIVVNFTDEKTSDLNVVVSKMQDVQNYMSTLSYNQMSIVYNVYVCNLNEKFSAYSYSKASESKDVFIMNNKSTYSCAIKNTNKQANGNMVFFSDRSIDKTFRSDTSLLFWPHCYKRSNDLIDLIIVTSQSEPITICHEFMHALGIGDFYTSSQYWWPLNEPFDDNLPLTFDLMTTSEQFGTQYTCINNRFMLGWLEMSAYDSEHQTDTPIKVISQAGTYVVNDANSTEGVVGYQFGEKDKERFTIECWSMFNKTFLIVNRINLEYNQNTRATKPSECYVYDLRGSDGAWLTEGCCIGTENYPIVYSDGTVAQFSISNITTLPNGALQFDFHTSININETFPQTNNSQSNFYLHTVDTSNNFVEVQQILVFNSENSEWKNATVSLVYINNKEVYALIDVDNKYTKAKVVYDAFGSKNEYVVDLSTKIITVKIEKNIIQTFGTAFFNFIDSVKKLFN